MYIYAEVEVTMNMAKYGSQRSQQPDDVNFEPIIRGLKSDIFDWGQVLNPFHICMIQLQKKNWGKKLMEICANKGRGPTPNCKCDFKFPFFNPPLINHMYIVWTMYNIYLSIENIVNLTQLLNRGCCYHLKGWRQGNQTKRTLQNTKSCDIKDF